MIRRLAVGLALLSGVLIGCGIGEAQQDLSSDKPIPAETTNDLAEAATGQPVPIDEPTSSGSTGAAATPSQPTGDAGAGDGADDAANGAGSGGNRPMSADVLEELERTLDEIDRLLADLELDLEAD